MSTVQVHIRVRPRLDALNETLEPPAVRRNADHQLTIRHVQTGTRSSASSNSSYLSSPSVGTPRQPQRTAGSSPATPRTPRTGTPPPPASPSTQTKQPVDDAIGFEFDRVYDETFNQIDVFEESVLEIVDELLDGADNASANATIFCYGPTGSGKTHTMLGNAASWAFNPPQLSPPRRRGGSPGATSEQSQQYDLHKNETVGALPRTVCALLQHLDHERSLECRRIAQAAGEAQAKRRNYLAAGNESGAQTCSASFTRISAISMYGIEVYMDEVRDLNAANKPEVKLRDHDTIDELLKHFCPARIDNLYDLLNFYNDVQSRRVVCSHSQNDQSSRSHALFLIKVHREMVTVPATYEPAKQPEALDGSPSRGYTWSPQLHVKTLPSSCLSLVDLAGSERVKKSNVQGLAMKEAQEINKSLTALSGVVFALHSNSKHIPYRDSKLTRLLKPSFENGKVLALIHVPPAPYTATEAFATLKFAERLKSVRLSHSNADGVGTGGPGAMTPDEIALEGKYFFELKAHRELCSDLRIANALTGNIPRRIGRCQTAQADPLWSKYFDVRHQAEKDFKEMQTLKEETINKGLKPLMDRRRAVEAALQNLATVRSALQTDLARLDGQGAESEVDTLRSRAKKAKKRRLVLENTKAAVVKRNDTLRRFEKELRKVEKGIGGSSDAALDSGTSNADIRLKELTSTERKLLEMEEKCAEAMLPMYPQGLESRDLMLHYTHHVVARYVLYEAIGFARDEVIAAGFDPDILAASPTTSSEQQLVSSSSSRTLRREASSSTLGSSAIELPSFRFEPNSATWAQPFVLSSGARFHPRPTLLGVYHDPSAIAHASVQLLKEGLDCTLVARYVNDGGDLEDVPVDDDDDADEEELVVDKFAFPASPIRGGSQLGSEVPPSPTGSNASPTASTGTSSATAKKPSAASAASSLEATFCTMILSSDSNKLTMNISVISSGNDEQVKKRSSGKSNKSSLAEPTIKRNMEDAVQLHLEPTWEYELLLGDSTEKTQRNVFTIKARQVVMDGNEGKKRRRLMSLHRVKFFTPEDMEAAIFGLRRVLGRALPAPAGGGPSSSLPPGINKSKGGPPSAKPAPSGMTRQPPSKSMPCGPPPQQRQQQRAHVTVRWAPHCIQTIPEELLHSTAQCIVSHARENIILEEEQRANMSPRGQRTRSERSRYAPSLATTTYTTTTLGRSASGARMSPTAASPNDQLHTNPLIADLLQEVERLANTKREVVLLGNCRTLQNPNNLNIFRLARNWDEIILRTCALGKEQLGTDVVFSFPPIPQHLLVVQ